MIYDMTPEHL